MIGGGLSYQSNGKLVYQAGRIGYERDVCNIRVSYSDGCRVNDKGYIRITNSKIFLVAGIGMVSWHQTLSAWIGTKPR